MGKKEKEKGKDVKVGFQKSYDAWGGGNRKKRLKKWVKLIEKNHRKRRFYKEVGEQQKQANEIGGIDERFDIKVRNDRL